MLWNLIAIDPGGTTGLAWASLRMQAKKSNELIDIARRRRAYEVKQIDGTPNHQAVEIQEYLEERMLKTGHVKQDAYDVRTVVACESYEQRPGHRKATELLAHTVGEKAEFFVWLTDPMEKVEWHWVKPGERSVVTDAMLHKWDLWVPGQRHAMDALQHLVVLIRKVQDGKV